MTRRKPNVLLIMTDQHRADMMSCAGRWDVPTPNIDRIAVRGTRFTNAYCPYPVCLASRSSLLTGLYAHHTGAVNNTDRLDWRYRTIAHHFSDNGYLTGLIGKMHFNDAHKHGFQYYLSINDWLMYLGPKSVLYANEIANHPTSQDHFFSTMIDDGAGFPDVSGLWEHGSPWVGQVKRFDFDTMRTMASELEAEDHLDMFIARESVKFLKSYAEHPFFLVTSFMKPHTPFFPPREYAEKYPIDDMILPPVGDIQQYPEHIQKRIRITQSVKPRNRKAHMAGYRGNLAFVDTCIGYVYDALEELGLLENTIVVYTSDHGEMDGDHGLFQKFCLFEPSVKVPLIISYPKHLPENKVNDALIEYIGLYPTLAELTETEMNTRTTLVEMQGAPKKIDSSSFSEMLFNENAQGPDAVFAEYNLKADICQYMIRTHKYKYIHHEGASHELYDLESDPQEDRNLINDPGMKGIIEELRDRLFEWYRPEENVYKPKRRKRNVNVRV
ncbi:MAG: sulfatase [Clostridia bacterium]